MKQNSHTDSLEALPLFLYVELQQLHKLIDFMYM